MHGDRERWDARYAVRGPELPLGVHWLEDVVELPKEGCALEIACGAGALACHLAARGLDVTAVDVSPEALALTHKLAAQQHLSLTTLTLDLDDAALPSGPFVLITCMHYLSRPLWKSVVERLAPGGLCAFEIATIKNLERNAHPSARFLVAPLELEQALGRHSELEIVYAREDWFGSQHQARVVARRTQRVQ